MPQIPVPSPPTIVTEPKPPNLPKSHRRKNGQFDIGNPGFSGYAGYDAARQRKMLNSRFLAGMTDAYMRGGQAAIDKVMKEQPAIFVKMLTLLVPREMEITHSNAIKQMSDEQIEAAIEHIQAVLAKREAGMIDVTPAAVEEMPAASPTLPQKRRERKSP